MARVHDIEHDSAGEGQGRSGGTARGTSRDRDAFSVSIPLMQLGGLRVRMHWIVPLYAACELAAALPHGGTRFRCVGSLVGSLIVLVLVREIGRGLLARRLGSGVPGVTMWPLGGLNTMATPSVGRPAACEAGGLLTSLVLAPVLAGAALAAGLDARTLFEFDPLAPGLVLARIDASPWATALWSAYYANAVVLVLNLLPMCPMDMGRILAARMRGRPQANERAARVGMSVALALLVVSVFASARL